jgi:hypothetical protein
MCLTPKPARATRYCKIKRVYPRLPLRVHSTVAKGLTGKGSGYPFRSKTPATGLSAAANRRPTDLGSASKTSRVRRPGAARNRWPGGGGRGLKDLLLVTLREGS